VHPILFHWNGHPHATYSFLVALGYIAGVLWLRLQLKHHGAAPAELWGLAAAVVGGGLLGGKLGYFVVERDAFLRDPAEMLRNWGSGWVFWSGLLTGMLAGLAYQWWHNRRYRPRAYLPVADDCMAAVAIGHVIGRLGCLAEGCCHGRPTSLPWGISFVSPACGVADALKGIPLHPTQLYEAFGEALAAFLLIRFVLPGVRAAKYRYGTGFFGYALYYSVMRFAVEMLRGDDRGSLFGAALSPSQWTSLFVGLAAAAALWKRGVLERDAAGRSLFLDGKP
jgi:phosphatidylglycerol:prolipoprotein diacylglycerol transferase